MKTITLRILPLEKIALNYVLYNVADGQLQGLSEFIRLLAFENDERAEKLRSALNTELYRQRPYTTTPTKRLRVSFRLSGKEWSALKKSRADGETKSDTMRRILRLRPISHLYRPAARASSRRGNKPVLTPEGIADYQSLVTLVARIHAALRCREAVK